MNEAAARRRRRSRYGGCMSFTPAGHKVKRYQSSLSSRAGRKHWRSSGSTTHMQLLLLRTSTHLLKLESSAAPLQSRSWPSELKSPDRHRPENVFCRQEAGTARPPPLNRDLDGATSCNAHPPYAQADHGDGSPQAPLTVYTMRRRQICKVVQTKVNSMLRCRAEARDHIRAEGGGNWHSHFEPDPDQI